MLSWLSKWRSAALIAILAAALGVYFQTFDFGFVAFDDDILVYENPLTWSIDPSTIRGAFTTFDPELYIPLTILSYQLDYAIGSGTAGMFHVTNVLLHMVNVILAYAFVRLLARGNHVVALLCAATFALHPLNTEAVTWISSRKDLLSTAFYLAALVGYLSFIRTRNKRHYRLSIVAATLGLLSKVMVITVPVALLLIDLHERREIDRKLLREKLPFVALSIVFGLIALYGKRHMIDTTPHSLKLLMAFKSSAFYLEKLLWPVELSVVYPFAGNLSWTAPAFLIPIVIVIAIIAAAIAAFRNHRTVFFGVAFFFVTVSPTFLNFAKAGEIFVASDRYAYLPAIGLFYPVFSRMVSRLSKVKSRAQYAATVLAVACFAALGVAAHRQASVWRNNRTFFEHALAFYPHSYVARTNYGNALLMEDRYDDAVGEYEKALEINDASPKTYGNLALAHARAGHIQEAVNVLAAGFARHPNSVELLMRLGDVRIIEGKKEEGLALYRKAAEINPLLIEKKFHAIQGQSVF